LATGVPGVMAGIGMLWEKWGRAPWASILAPAQELLDRGFTFRDAAPAVAAKQDAIRRYPSSVKHLMPAGRLPQPDDVWHRRDMERTLRRLETAGWRDFYQGDLARRIAAHVADVGGILTLDDLKRFEPRITPPYETRYRNARISSAVLANGGATVAQFLNMMACFEPLPENDPRHWHRLIELMKLAWRDRIRYLGDPAHARVPLERLLSTDYAAGRVEHLRQHPDAVDRLPAPAAGSSPGTANISAVDAEGNLIACTSSHGGSFGSCLTVPDTGITLGHGMCRFDPHPGLPNSVGPGKRPLNNVCPTIVSLPGRDIAVGQRGGRRIVSVVAQMCQRFVDWNQTAAEAVAAPRLHVEQQEPGEFSESLPPAIAARLRALGHDFTAVKAVGGHANACERLNDGRLRGASNVWAAGVS
ncbi:MAG TPA: gamma-glutamyltransferase, partial [Beijerinckiaceae bacterium]|nr:gamma-glutamyltransferase [Beijerinckiaceae bacterium]